jgi:hypothetical protein
LPYIETEVSNSVLIIKKHGHKNLDNHSPIRVHIKVPYINGMELSGSGDITCSNLNSSNGEIEVSGSGDVFVTASCHKIDGRISGSGNITISGAADETNLEIDGSGAINAYNLEQDTCFIDISGSGDAFLNVAKFLDVHISGSGEVHYMGNPDVNTQITGSGKVIHE